MPKILKATKKLRNYIRKVSHEQYSDKRIRIIFCEQVWEYAINTCSTMHEVNAFIDGYIMANPPAMAKRIRKHELPKQTDW